MMTQEHYREKEHPVNSPMNELKPGKVFLVISVDLQARQVLIISEELIGHLDYFDQESPDRLVRFQEVKPE